MEGGISKVILLDVVIVIVSFNLGQEALIHGVKNLNSSTGSDRSKSFFMTLPV